MTLIGAVAVTMAVISSQQVWIEQDFSQKVGYQAVAPRDRLSGALPTGWRDESAWCPAIVQYNHVDENGTGFLRASADGNGKLQFMLPLQQRLTASTAWRITLRCRSTPGVGLLLGIRQQDRPADSDRFFATALFNPSDAWKDYSFTMRAGADPKPIALYLNFGVHGKPVQLDLASLRLEQIDPAEHEIATLIPMIREEGAVQHHRARAALAAKQQPQVILLGDSISDGFDDGEGKSVWAETIAPLNAVNFGIGANRIEHVLWQVQNMDLGTAFTPKVIVLMIGINNYFHVDSDIDICDGIDNLVREIRARSPQSRLLLLGILPQGRDANTLRRKQIQLLNLHYATLADNRNVFFLDMGQSFLNPAGHFGEDLSRDATHLTAKGYAIWSREMLPVLLKMLGR